MTSFSVENPDYVKIINGISVLGEGFLFTGENTTSEVTKTIKIIGADASTLRNSNVTWPSAIPSAGQVLAISSVAYQADGDLETLILDWSSSAGGVFSQIGTNLFNTSVGTPAGSNNFIAGVGAAATLQGSQCVVIGALSGSTNMENDNVIIGYQAMDSVTAFVAGANSSNIAIGTGALDSGNGGVAGQNVNNVCIGEDAGTTLSTGRDNICIGISSDVSVNSAINQIIIGQGAIGKGDNTALIGNDSTTDVYLGARSNGAPPNMVLTGDNAGGSDFLYKIRAPSNASLNSQREWILPNNTPTANQVLTVSSVAAGPPNVATLGWSMPGIQQVGMVYTTIANARTTTTTPNTWIRFATTSFTMGGILVDGGNTSDFSMFSNSGLTYTGANAYCLVNYGMNYLNPQDMIQSGVVAIGPASPPSPTEPATYPPSSVRMSSARGASSLIGSTFCTTINTNDNIVLWFATTGTVTANFDFYSVTMTIQVLRYI